MENLSHQLQQKVSLKMQKFENTLRSGKCLRGEMSAWGSLRRVNVQSGICSSRCPSGKCQSGICPRGSVSPGTVRSRNCSTISQKRCLTYTLALFISITRQIRWPYLLSFLVRVSFEQASILHQIWNLQYHIQNLFIRPFTLALYSQKKNCMLKG